jgi:hypothetical protein
MIVKTNAPILEDSSNVVGKGKGTFGKMATEKFKGGYGRLKESGALPVIENLLGLGQKPQDFSTNPNFNPPPPPPPPPPTGMSTTVKVVIGVVVVGSIIGAFMYFKRAKGNSSNK